MKTLFFVMALVAMGCSTPPVNRPSPTSSETSSSHGSPIDPGREAYLNAVSRQNNSLQQQLSQGPNSLNDDCRVTTNDRGKPTTGPTCTH
jgi:hypothetical protein